MGNKIHFARISSLIHLKLLVERWNHVGLKNKYQKSEIRSAEYRINALLGDFPPKNLDLCSKCRAVYTVAGIIKPPITFDEMVKLLYQFDMLCSEPCGVTTPHLLPQQHPASSKFPIIFEGAGISCNNCKTSLIVLSIMSQSESEVKRTIRALQNKSLVCADCLLAFTNHIDGISAEVISAVRGTV